MSTNPQDDNESFNSRLKDAAVFEDLTGERESEYDYIDTLVDEARERLED